MIRDEFLVWMVRTPGAVTPPAASARLVSASASAAGPPPVGDPFAHNLTPAPIDALTTRVDKAVSAGLVKGCASLLTHHGEMIPP